MTRLGTVIAEAILLNYGREELLRRLAHPFWFQSFGAVMGMDWHSSGITTSVLSALKRGLNPRSAELGIHVCGGRGRHSRETPVELADAGNRAGFDGEALGQVSRLVAKVDSAALQDGFDLYLHGFIVTDDGAWTVVQQGMNGSNGTARRYHWLSEGLESFVDSPHSAIEGREGDSIINLADRRAAPSRQAQIDLLAMLGPDGLVREAAALRPKKLNDQPALPHLLLPSRHDVTSDDIVLRRLHGSLAAAVAAGPSDFVDLLKVPGIDARTIRSLALVAEVVHGAPCRFSDPARFSLAHGGKDGHPFPVPLKVYDKTIAMLKSAVEQAKLGQDEKLGAIRRLDDQARRLEGYKKGPSLDAFLAEERSRSHEYGG
ncbi:MAG: DUF763 domain-containing protein [Allosphingosinicella sp.]